MQKLIVSSASLSYGGAERVLSILSASLADRFDSIIYILWIDKPHFYQIDSRVKIICIEKEINGKCELKKIRWFRSFVRREKPNLILSFLEPYNLRVLLSTIGLDIKTIVAERNDPRSVNKYWLMNKIEKMVYRLADGIIVQTKTIKDFFDGALKGRTHIIYNPVIIPFEMVGKALQTPKKNRIVTIARLTRQKKNDMLIRVFAKFLKSHPNYTLTIYGDGPQKEELNELARILNISNQVLLPGASKTVHQDILDAKMMCLVSVREGMSNAMIEAMSLGLPCICTRVSGAIDLISSGKNGFLINIGDEEALLQQMCKIADNPNLAETIGREATHLFETLRADNISIQWVNYLDSFIHSK